MAIAPGSRPRATYTRIAYAKMFANNSDNPAAPSLGNSKVEILEDLQKGDIVSFSGWVNQDPQTGDKTLSIMIQRRDDAPEAVAQPATVAVTEDDIPFS